MIRLFCDLCGKEIINQDYVEQTIFNHFDFDSSVDAHICKECWEKQSPTSQTSPNGDFSNEKKHKILTNYPKFQNRPPKREQLNNKQGDAI
jgi:hypothetical protein